MGFGLAVGTQNLHEVQAGFTAEMLSWSFSWPLASALIRWPGLFRTVTLPALASLISTVAVPWAGLGYTLMLVSNLLSVLDTI